VPEQTPAGAMPTALKNLVGRAFIVDVVASKQTKQDGSPYLNTNVSGPGTPPQAVAPVQQQVDPMANQQFAQPPAAPAPQPQQGFPVAPPVDGGVLPQQPVAPVPGAQFGDNVPWT